MYPGIIYGIGFAVTVFGTICYDAWAKASENDIGDWSWVNSPLPLIASLAWPFTVLYVLGLGLAQPARWLGRYHLNQKRLRSERESIEREVRKLLDS